MRRCPISISHPIYSLMTGDTRSTLTEGSCACQLYFKRGKAAVELEQKTCDFSDRAKDHIKVARKAAAELNQKPFDLSDGAKDQGKLVRRTVVGAEW